MRFCVQREPLLEVPYPIIRCQVVADHQQTLREARLFTMTISIRIGGVA